MKDIKKLTFAQKIFKSGMTPNMLAAGLIFFYSMIFISIRMRQIAWAFLIVGVIVVLA